MRLARAEPGNAASVQEISDRAGARYLVERSRVTTGDTVVLCREAGPDTENTRLLELAVFSMDNASDGIFWLGPDGRFEYANRTGCRMLGYELAELRTLSICDIDRDVSPHRWPQIRNRVRRDAPYTFDATHQGKDGRPIPVQISVFSADPGGHEMICYFARHIAERSRTEALLQEQRLRAERANRLKTEFIARMSHELRTPLNAIIGFAEIISEGHLGPKGAARYGEFGGNILTSARHLQELIKDVLDLTQIEMGAETLQLESLDAAVLAEAARTIVQPMAESAGVELRIQQDAPPSPLFADSRRMMQILVNLLSNGIKHAPRGSEVSLTVRHDRAGGWSFAVADRGPGIPPEDIPLALSVFGQLHTEETDKPDDGVGLGLPIVNALVERHGGSLGFEAREGGGMVVTVHIPDGIDTPVEADTPARSAAIK